MAVVPFLGVEVQRQERGHWTKHQMYKLSILHTTCHKISRIAVHGAPEYTCSTQLAVESLAEDESKLDLDGFARRGHEIQHVEQDALSVFMSYERNASTLSKDEK